MAERPSDDARIPPTTLARPSRGSGECAGAERLGTALLLLICCLPCAAPAPAWGGRASSAQHAPAGAALRSQLILPRTAPAARPELVPQTGQICNLTSVAFSPDGRIVAAASVGQVTLWDTSLEKLRYVFRGHKDYVWSVAFSPDGQVIASAGNDGVILWQPATGQILRRLTAHSALVSSVAFSPDGRILASGGWDGRIILWNVATAQAIRALPAYSTCLAFSPDGSVLASGGYPLDTCPMVLQTPPPAKTWRGVTLWKVATGKRVKALGASAAWLAFSPDGKTLATNTGPPHESPRATDPPFPARPTDGSVVLWDVGSGAARRVLKAPARRAGDREYPAYETGCVFRPGGEQLLVGTEAGDVLVWDLTGRGPKVTTIAATRTSAVACSPDGSTLACANASDASGELALVDLARTRLRATLQCRSWQMTSLAFSPDGRDLLAIEGNAVEVWDLATGQLRRELVSHDPATGFLTQYAGTAIYSADGSLIAAAGPGDDLDLALLLWDAHTGELRRSLPGPAAAGTTTAGGSQGHPTWRGAAGTLRFSESGETVVFCDYLGGVTWDLVTGAASSLGLPESDVHCLDPEGRYAALGRGQDVSIWDVHRDQLVATLAGIISGRASSLDLSPEARLLAVGSSDGAVAVWEVASKRRLAQLCTEPPGSAPTKAFSLVTFSADASLLAFATRRSAGLWDWRTGTVVRELKDWSHQTRRLVWSPDASRLATPLMLGPTAIWDAKTGRQLVTLIPIVGERGADVTNWVVTTPEGYYDCSSPSTAIVWRIGEYIYPFDQFEEKFRRPDLVRRALAGEDISAAPALDGTQIPPNIAFTSPEYGAEVTGPSASVMIEAAGVRSISSVELWVNGRPASPQVAAALQAHPSDGLVQRFAVTVPLPAGEPTVRLRALAYDSERLRSQPAELYLRRPGVRQQPAKLYLLSTGISNYRNPAWNTLRYADADARAFADAFVKQQGVQYANVEQRVLTNENARLSDLKFALRWLKDSAAEGDVAVVFMAGHGVARADGYYFLCYDSEGGDPANTALPWQDFVSLLREVRAKRLLVFVDTCHAGFVTGFRTADTMVEQLNRQAGALVFSASRGEEVSLEGADWGHGAFTKALLEGLAGKADTTPAHSPRGMRSSSDSEVSLEELQAFVAARVAQLTANRQHPYVARLQGLEPDAVIARVP